MIFKKNHEISFDYAHFCLIKTISTLFSSQDFLNDFWLEFCHPNETIPCFSPTGSLVHEFSKQKVKAKTEIIVLVHHFFTREEIQGGN